MEEVVKFKLPLSEIERSFVKIHKESCTKNKYPRKAGVPGKKSDCVGIADEWGD